MQKNYVRDPACALESAIRAQISRYTWAYRNVGPEVISVCRYTVAGAARYLVAFTELDWHSELEPEFLTLTTDVSSSERLLRDFGPNDFLRLQQLVEHSALTVTADQMRAAVARYNRLMSMPPWQQTHYLIKKRRSQA